MSENNRPLVIAALILGLILTLALAAVTWAQDSPPASAGLTGSAAAGPALAPTIPKWLPMQAYECFISCGSGFYACCNRGGPGPLCRCVSLANEVQCDVYGFEDNSVDPPRPAQCTNG